MSLSAPSFLPDSSSGPAFVPILQPSPIPTPIATATPLHTTFPHTAPRATSGTLVGHLARSPPPPFSRGSQRRSPHTSRHGPPPLRPPSLPSTPRESSGMHHFQHIPLHTENTPAFHAPYTGPGHNSDPFPRNSSSVRHYPRAQNAHVRCTPVCMHGTQIISRNPSPSLKHLCLYHNRNCGVDTHITADIPALPHRHEPTTHHTAHALFCSSPNIHAEMRHCQAIVAVPGAS